MKRAYHFLFSIIFLLCSLFSFSQNKAKVDSLLSAIKISADDTNKVNSFLSLSLELQNINPDSSILLCTNSLTLSEKIKWDKGIVQSNHHLGLLNWRKGEYEKALVFLQKSFSVCEKQKEGVNKSDNVFFQTQKSKTLGTMGVVYADQGNYPEALKQYFNALAIDEKLDNKYGVARHLINIGIIYKDQSDLQLALDNYFKALKIVQEINNKSLQAATLSNIATVYLKLAEKTKQPEEQEKHFSSALEYFLLALKIDEELGNKRGKAIRLGNISMVYEYRKDYNKSLEYLLPAIKIFEELGAKKDLALNYGNLGGIYTQLKQTAKAEEYLKKGVEMCYAIGALQYIMEFEKSLSNLYSQTGKHVLALEHYKKYTAAKDSMFNDEKSKEIGKLEAASEFEKQKAVADAEHIKELELSAEREKRQEIVSYAVGGGLLLVLVFAVFIFNRFRVTQKQKKIIEEQKHLVEEKQKEILDSIRYAKRIQQTLFPSEKYIDKTLKRLNNK